MRFCSWSPCSYTVKQVVTLATIRGVRITMHMIDNLLVETCAVPDSDLCVFERRQAAEDAEEVKTKTTRWRYYYHSSP